MSRAYSNLLKKAVCQKICIEKQSTSKVASELEIPIKTVEKWITLFNKDNHCFDKEDGYIYTKRKQDARRYDKYTKQELKALLKSRDNEIDHLRSIIESIKL